MARNASPNFTLNNYSDFSLQVDAQNKFTGKSFEIRPTGVANVDILIPAEWGPTYPKYTSKYMDSERAIEHYSWKKVTTNISGFILGSPTIDHYGDMIVCSSRILSCGVR
jgi:oxysterol-binding protein 1